MRPRLPGTLAALDPRHGAFPRRLLAAACLCAVSLGCNVASIAGPLPLGTWGGSQGNLTVWADSAALDLPCAAGRIPAPLVTGPDGRFQLDGLWAPQVGPVSIDGPSWQPARYTGIRSGRALAITIVLLKGGSSLGPLQFRRGVIGQFPRCL